MRSDNLHRTKGNVSVEGNVYIQLVSKTLYNVPTDAHYYKIHRMLKQLKIITLALTCFGSRRNHQQGAVLCLAKTTKYGFSVLVGIDAVNVMSVYQSVVRACREQQG